MLGDRTLQALREHATLRRVLLGLGLFLLATGAVAACGDQGMDDGPDGGSPQGGGAGMANGDATGGGKPTGAGGEAAGTGGSAGSLGPSSGGGAGGPSLGGAGPDADTECNDGIDNDGDGYIDYELDPGCYGPGDRTEAAGTRAAEDGFTTWDFSEDSLLIYVSNDGDDQNDGLSPDSAVSTLARASQIARDGEHDFIRLRRGDTWRDEGLGRFISGKDPEHPVVVGSYGKSLERPRLELSDDFLDHDGQTRNFVALVDLHFYMYQQEPGSPDFTGTNYGALRLVGNGQGMLVEGCHFEYAAAIFQGTQGSFYEDVQFRGNVVEKAYHINTCEAGNPNGNADFRPSGIYSRRIHGFVVEGNVFDTNGWNPEVDSACATIYNHHVYLNAHDLVIADNIFARPSSIHIKLSSDVAGDLDRVTIDNNYFVEGEIGVSIGGNGDSDFRFTDSVIRRNVMSDVGRSQPTTRVLAWGIDVQDNDGLLVEDNYFLNQLTPGVNNSYAVLIGADTERDVTVQGNLFYRIQTRNLWVRQAPGHENIRVIDNTFVDPDQDSCLIRHEGAFTGYSYLGNSYYSAKDPGAWFCVDSGSLSLQEWESASGEAGAQAIPQPDYVNPNRTVESYADDLGLDASIDGFMSEARLQSRLRWYPALTAGALNNYVRAGFETD